MSFLTFALLKQAVTTAETKTTTIKWKRDDKSCNKQGKKKNTQTLIKKLLKLVLPKNDHSDY